MSAVRRLGVACAVAAFALDQGSKAIVVASPALAAIPRPGAVSGFLNIAPV